CAMLFFSSRRRNTSFSRDWSSDVCSSDLSASNVGSVAPPFGHLRKQQKNPPSPSLWPAPPSLPYHRTLAFRPAKEFWRSCCILSGHIANKQMQRINRL